MPVSVSVYVCVCETIITVNLHAACVNRPLAICNYGASCTWLYILFYCIFIYAPSVFAFRVFLCSFSKYFIYMMVKCIAMQIMLSS